mmetsp:Transcript_38151/g.75056  ORF Transcript_38151/g.75056 Transcript_38151/m.75056 type:complete len:227 (-) Transcript_38151:122-802(-)
MLASFRDTPSLRVILWVLQADKSDQLVFVNPCVAVVIEVSGREEKRVRRSGAPNAESVATHVELLKLLDNPVDRFFQPFGPTFFEVVFEHRNDVFGVCGHICEHVETAGDNVGVNKVGGSVLEVVLPHSFQFIEERLRGVRFQEAGPQPVNEPVQLIELLRFETKCGLESRKSVRRFIVKERGIVKSDLFVRSSEVHQQGRSSIAESRSGGRREFNLVQRRGFTAP